MKHCFLLIIFAFSLASCNFTRYYAYEDSKGYYSFEVKKRKAIYRATSSRYIKVIPDGYDQFIYMASYESPKGAVIYFSPASLRTMYAHEDNPYGITVNPESLAAYARSYSTVELEYIKSGTKNELHLFESYDKLLLTFGKDGAVVVDWMPPRLKRVKKIDYDKLARVGYTYGFDFENPW